MCIKSCESAFKNSIYTQFTKGGGLKIYYFAKSEFNEIIAYSTDVEE